MNTKPEMPPIDDLKIAAYVDGRLAAGERDAFENMLAGSKEYREYLSLARKAAIDAVEQRDDDPVPEHLLKKAIGLYRQKLDMHDIIVSLSERIFRVLRWSPEVGFSFPAPAGAMRRDRGKNPSMAVVTKVFDDMVVEVGIEQVSEKQCNFMINARDRTSKAPCENIRAELMSRGREYASCLLTNGEAIFEDVRPGRYDILFRQNDDVRGRLTIRIDE
jgi:hypothetical protein